MPNFGKRTNCCPVCKECFLILSQDKFYESNTAFGYDIA